MLAENPKVFPIEAGYEPVDFTTLFPFWKERQDVQRYSNKVNIIQQILRLLHLLPTTVANHLYFVFFQIYPNESTILDNNVRSFTLSSRSLSQQQELEVDVPLSTLHTAS